MPDSMPNVLEIPAGKKRRWGGKEGGEGWRQQGRREKKKKKGRETSVMPYIYIYKIM